MSRHQEHLSKMSKVVPFNSEEEDDNNLWDAEQTEGGSFDVESQETVAENVKGGVNTAYFERLFTHKLEKKIQARFSDHESQSQVAQAQNQARLSYLESKFQVAQARISDLESQSQVAQAQNQARISDLESRLNLVEKCKL